MMVPEIGELLAATLILGWAFAESVYDVKELLAGEKIPLLKTDATWHYGLSSALQGELPGTSEEDASGSDSPGMGYEDYLRIFLLLCEENLLPAGLWTWWKWIFEILRETEHSDWIPALWKLQ